MSLSRSHNTGSLLFFLHPWWVSLLQQEVYLTIHRDVSGNSWHHKQQFWHKRCLQCSRNFSQVKMLNTCYPPTSLLCSLLCAMTPCWDWGIFILTTNIFLGYTCSWSQTVQVADMAIALHRFQPSAQPSSDSLRVTLSRGAKQSDSLRVYQRSCQISCSLEYFWDTMQLLGYQFKKIVKKQLPLLLIFDRWRKKSRCLSQRYIAL